MILSSEISIYFILIQTLYLRSASGGGGVIIAIWKYIRLHLFVVEFASTARGKVFLYISFAKYRCVLIVFIVAFIDNSCSAFTKAGIADLRIATA